MSIMLVMILLLLSACSNKTAGDEEKTGDSKNPAGTITYGAGMLRQQR